MIRLFAKHPTAANLLMALFLILGLLVLPSLVRETFPDITPQRVQISVVYPGGSSREIEESICQRIEDAVDGIQFVKEAISEAREGMGTVTAEMEEGGNILAFKDDISTEVEAIKNDFPSGAENPTIKQLGTTDKVLSILVTGPMSTVDLKAYCEDVKRRLQRLEEVSLVEVSGFSDHQFRIELSSESLQKYNLSVNDVATVVSSQNVDIPAGGIESNQKDLLLRFSQQGRTAKELETIVIKGGVSGAEVRVSDLGKVVDLFEADEQKVLLGKKRAGKLTVKKTKQEDQIRVAKAAKEFLEKEREKHPQVQLFVSGDGSTLVVDRISLVLVNGLQGMVLVFLTLALFFNWRLSFWVAMSLPVSFLGAIFLMPYYGMTINMMTMVGMLMALGILMDDGIVIAENVAAHRAMGKSGLQAAIDGVNEVKTGVFASFITTVCVLGPLIFITGNIGKVLATIPVMLILVLAVSLVEAYAILPAHLGHSLSHSDPNKANWLRRQFDKWFEWLKESVFGRFVDLAISWRYLFVGSVLGIMVVSLALVAGGLVRFTVFPSPEGDTITAKLILPAGTPLRRTEEVVSKVVQGLEEVDRELTPLQPEKQALVSSYNVEFNVNTDANETGPHVATVTVDLLGTEERSSSIDQIIALWKEKTGEPADVISLVISEPTFGPAGRPIEVRIQGDRLEDLKSAAQDSIAWFNRFKGVRGVADDLRKGKPELQIKLKPGALSTGLNASTMARQLQAAFQGITADEIQIGRESYEIDVRLNRGEQDSIEDLDNFRFTMADGTQIPIQTVATIQKSRGWSRISRIDGLRTITVTGDADSNVVSGREVVNLYQKEFVPRLKEKYPSILFNFEGEAKEGSKTAASIGYAMGIGLIGVFILLSFQFESYLEPLVVMIAIPLSLIGVIIGHGIMGIDMCLPSILGFVSLAGVVVNDSILLVIFLKKSIQSGEDVYQSASNASRQRFRAILLTSTTTVAGLVPLMFESSQQAQTLIPLAVSIAFGITASTVLVLIMIPCIYAILADFHLLKKPVEDH